jgi:uncharacterized protein with PQ loop repeat
MSENIDIVGLCGSFGIGLSLFPQTYKVFKDNTIQNLSIYYISITYVSSLCMIIYSVYYYILPMIIANLCVMINTMILLFLFCTRDS